jgi:hypothetical protein
MESLMFFWDGLELNLLRQLWLAAAAVACCCSCGLLLQLWLAAAAVAIAVDLLQDTGFFSIFRAV